ncbi:hypothetical protein Mlab_0790 [Methanocorpusculum labreanum Z]|uniref:Uncharacterized protein n=1 Tax=Methanocorpusculum labreanum (strain ATCC 43576 / DSM 4855 / Z) TaxID=410358 RepID=A2SRK5_METLZ|nr:hypothetical protein [Methanocorpusculum labreanum]ABN06961.1 hypothetical protein Mlab_0790 [Methanocorpusculum labreanum Z]
MNSKLLFGMLITLIVCISAAGCTAAPNDPAPYELAGTWVSVDGGSPVISDLTLVCYDNGTAKLIGSISGGGMSKTLNANLKWEYVSGNQYVGKSGDNSLPISLSGNTIKITVNPKKLGIADIDIDYELSMNRLASSPDALVGLWNGTIEGTVSNEVMIDFLKDGTGSISVIYYLDGIEKQEKKDMAWEYVDGNKYQATYDSNTVSLELFGDVLTISLIPSEFIPGTSNSPVTVLTKSFILPTPYIESPV